MYTEEMLEATLAGGRDAPAHARVALHGLNGSLATTRQSVTLLVSELVANAVQHAPAGPDATIRLKLTSSAKTVHVEVIDEGTGFEPPAKRTEPLRDGFGLALLDQLADRWGVTVDRGTSVWFEIDRATGPGS